MRLGYKKQATVKPERFYIFHPIDCVFLTAETGYNLPELGLFGRALYSDTITGNPTKLGFERNGRT